MIGRSLAIGLFFLALAIVSWDASQTSLYRALLEPTTIADVWGIQDQESEEWEKAFTDAEMRGLWSVWRTTLQMPAFVVVSLAGAFLFLLSVRWGFGGARDGRSPKDQRQAAANAAVGSGLGHKPRKSELAHALSTCGNAFIGVGIFSAVCNILMLTGAFYMLQVYDRVLPSRSEATLLALSVLIAGLFLGFALLDMMRRRILLRIGLSLDEQLSGRIFNSIVQRPLKSSVGGDGLRPLRDFDAIRTFLSGQGPTALFDLPWIPVYLGIIYSMHPVLGLAALLGAIVLVALTLTTEMLTRGPTLEAAAFATQRNSVAEASRRNAEVLAAMGMTERMSANWSDANQNYMSSQKKTSDVANDFGSISKAFRLLLQSAVLGIGAYFAIRGEASAGIIIAASILTARALAPVDLAIANWKGFVAARQSWSRLNQLFASFPLQSAPMPLPSPQTRLSVENASAVPPGLQKPIVHDVSFELRSGHGLAIIGPSGSGKSSLARLLVGVWQPARGRVRLDGAALSQWAPEALGQHVGYLPQDVELFAGSVAENISRFEPNAAPDEIVAAASAAGVHELIVSFPDGYDTQLGDQGSVLSAGQRQRIALARALYRDPFLVVLDEPNSNLDGAGEAALRKAILSVRARKGIVIIIAHRKSSLAGVDFVLTMAEGRAVAFGPKDEVLSKVLQSVRRSSSPVTAEPKFKTSTP